MSGARQTSWRASERERGFLQAQEIDVSEEGDFREALAQAWDDGEAVLIGHGWDGVIWGVIREGRFEVAADHGKHGSSLRRETLLELRVFDSSRELRLWRVGRDHRSCVIREQSERGGEEVRGLAYEGWGERDYWLLRSPSVRRPEPAPFVELSGTGGQLHAPPGRPTPPQKLRVRHYLARDRDSGLLREAAHRLIALVPWEEGS